MSFSLERFMYAYDITVDNDDRVLVLAYNTKDYKRYVHVFSTAGKRLFSFDIKDSMTCQARRIAFQPESEQVVIMFGSFIDSDEYPKMFQMYTKHGEFVRSIHCDTGFVIVPFGSQGMVVTRNGRTAMCDLDKNTNKHKILIV